jgi:hypothetical protein
MENISANGLALQARELQEAACDPELSISEVRFCAALKEKADLFCYT